MDATHGAVAAVGVAVSWWFLSSREGPRTEPPACHCVCAVKSDTPTGSDNSFLLIVIGLVGILLCANLILVFKVSVKQGDGGEKEYTFSFKGKSGKGVYNPTRGFQITDR